MQPYDHYQNALARSQSYSRAPEIKVDLAGPLRMLIHNIKIWRRRRQTAAQLAALDDAVLKDIGLTRADIPECVARMTPADLGV